MKDLRNQLLNLAKKHETQTLELPQLGGKIYIKSMTIAERMNFEKRFADADGEIDALDVTVQTVIASACNEDGEPLFTDDDADALKQLPSGVMLTIVQAANKINGLIKTAVEAAEKNWSSALIAAFYLN